VQRFKSSANRTLSLTMFSFDVQDKQEVVIEKIVRNKRKCFTVVKGLELFGELFYSLNKICMTEMA